MKNLTVSHEFDGFKRLESRTDEYFLHEDYLMLARDCERAARECYIAERTDDKKQKDEALKRLESINSEIKCRLEIIKGYREEKQND